MGGLWRLQLYQPQKPSLSERTLYSGLCQMLGALLLQIRSAIHFQTIMWHVLRFSGILQMLLDLFGRIVPAPGRSSLGSLDLEGENLLPWTLFGEHPKFWEVKHPLKLWTNTFSPIKETFWHQNLVVPFEKSALALARCAQLSNSFRRYVQSQSYKPGPRTLEKGQPSPKWGVEVRCLEVWSVEKHIITLWQFVTCDCRGTCISKCRGGV